MRPNSRRRPDVVPRWLPHTFVIASIGIASLSGCASPPVSQPPAPEVRAKFARIGLSLSSGSSAPTVSAPASAGKSLSEVFDSQGRTGTAEGAAFAIALSPLLALGGAMLDGLEGEPTRADQENLRTLHQAARSIRFEALLRERTVARTQSHFPGQIPFAEVALDAPLDRTRSGTQIVPGRAQSQIFPSATTRQLFWARPDLDTWLDIETLEPGLSTDGRRLRMTVHVRVRLERHGGEVLHYDYLEYRGPAHSPAEWAADNARLFHAEVNRSATLLADEIVDQLFVRAALDAKTSRQLTALGITRR